MTKSLSSLGAGSGSVLVTHRAALGRCGGREGHKQQRKAESREYRKSNCEASLHLRIKSPNGATTAPTAMKKELQRLKPPLPSAYMSWLKPRPTKISNSRTHSEV